MSHEHHAHVEPPKPHVLPLSLYWGVFGALVFLTLVTVATARPSVFSFISPVFDQVTMGPLGVPVALAIASAKAALVALVFMHLWWDHKQNALLFCMTLLFLAIFIVLTMADTETRGLIDQQKENFVPRNEMLQQYREQNPDGPAPRHILVPGTELKTFEFKAPDPAKLHNVDGDH